VGSAFLEHPNTKADNNSREQYKKRIVKYIEGGHFYTNFPAI
jgi:hypothetical protein